MSNHSKRLPENWSRHTAPSGHYYYYNSLTKESTYEKPKLEPKSAEGSSTLQAQEFPLFKYDIPGDAQWSIIFTNTGSHFYYNNETKESHWLLKDEKVNKVIEDLDKRHLLLLAAKARGFQLPKEVEIELESYTKPSHQITKSNVTTEKESQPAEGLEVPIQDALVEKSSTEKFPLVSGYSSSEEESDDEIIDSEKSEDTSSLSGNEKNLEDLDPSSDEGEFDLKDLDDVSSDEEVPDSSDGNSDFSKARFISLLEESSLNPYNTWENESVSIINDPRFYEIIDNNQRKELFNNWGRITIETLESQNGNNEQNESNSKEDPFVRYIRFIEGKEAEKLYIDFKNKWSNDLSQFELSEREKEKFYKEYLIFIKKPAADRERIFKQFLSTAKIFKKNLLSSTEAKPFLSNIDVGTLDQLTDDAAYSLLHELEISISLSDSLKFNTKYYITDVRKRIRLISELCNLILG